MRWLIVFSFLISFQFSFSQNYIPFPNQAIWRVDVHSCVYCTEDIANCYCSRYQYEIDGDTISGLYTYKKLRKSGEHINGTNYIINEYAGAFRQDIPNKKVYYLIPNTTIDTLLYDFDLEIGDTLPPTYTNIYLYDDHVISIDSIIIGGQYHKRFEISDSPFCRYWVEGVGSIAGLLEPMDEFETSYNLICFIRDGMWYYQFQAVPPNQVQCDIITNITEPEKTNIEIYPNPATSSVTLEFPASSTFKNAELSILTITGQGVNQTSIQNLQTTIDVSGYSKGFYLFKVQTGDEVVVKKVIVK